MRSQSPCVRSKPPIACPVSCKNRNNTRRVVRRDGAVFARHFVGHLASIPSVTLALAELEVRNTILDGPDQPLHRALLEQAVGSRRTNDVFTSTRTSTAAQMLHHPSFLSRHDSTVSGNPRQQQKQRKGIVIVGTSILVGYPLPFIYPPPRE